ncbi:MAG: hypothetical protein R3F11_29695 [Verrucomicrobiales bacterium]
MLDDEMVAEFESEASAAEREQLEGWFGVRRVINRRDVPHIVSTSLFWKHVDEKDGEVPPLDRDTLVNAKSLGLVKRMPPWEHYV